jgi:hypothetical protein
MSGIAFIDIDGVVADNTKRFALAEEAKKQYIRQHSEDEDVLRTATSEYWKVALNGEHVHLDTLIDGVPLYLTALEARGYIIIFLTSRPEHMREATEVWMNQHSLLHPLRRLDMKPAEAQFVKTIVWKIDRLLFLATTMLADEVLFVDDEPPLRQELVDRASEVPYSIKVCSSLEMACEE